jgi:hypothetical protein
METVLTELKYIDVTNHCKERYVERVKGITNSFDIKNYVLTNNDRIVRDINKIFNYSEFLTEDRLGGDGTIKRFYVKDDILLVLRRDESVIITLIKVDYGFPEKINRGIVKELLEEINSLKEDLQESEKAIISYINVRNLEKERILNKVELLKKQIKEIDMDIEGKRKSINMPKLRIKKYVNMIYNSMELRKDIEQLVK